MKKRILLYGVLIGTMIFLSACQKTPDKTVIVQKDSNMLEKVTISKLDEGEKQTVLEAKHWQVSEQKGDHVRIEADIEIPQLEVSDLPVIEMENEEMTEETLKQLSNLFLQDETVLEADALSKDMLPETLIYVKSLAQTVSGVF
ncbi:MAG: DUF6034 family protein [Eubacteriales bacterium]|nr:DUF6034 family protein [Eubacteriales bacterium]